jgi:outer membrane protein OmpA-like peptidoglycan-associated protein
LRPAVSFLSVAALGLSLACATPEPAPRAVNARPLQPAADERVVVDQLLVVVDSSGSLEDGGSFFEERALVESFVASTPDGDYEAGSVAFGGFERVEIPMARFDREGFRSESAKTPHLRSGTPLHKVLGEARQPLAGRSGRAAVVIFSDGLVTDEFGRSVEEDRVVASARELVEAHDGTLCFHTVQVGESVEGARLLRRISELTECGSTRAASAASNEKQLHALHRDVFIGARTPVAAKRAAPAPPPVSAAPPAAAEARNRYGVNFGFDSAEIDSRYRKEFSEIAARLDDDPQARIRIQGHTDTRGNPEYNRKLSMRRAEATRGALVEAGVDPSRIEVEAMGEGAPLFADDRDDASQAANRRTDIEIVR